MLWIHTFELAKRKGRTVMTSGLLLIIIAGICWIGAGIIVSACSARSWNYNIVQGLSYLGATLICALLLIGKAVSHSSWEAPGWSVLASCLAGIANFYVGPGVMAGLHNNIAPDVHLGGQLGVEFELPSIPMNISLDWRPGFSFMYNHIVWTTFGLGIRYRF